MYAKGHRMIPCERKPEYEKEIKTLVCELAALDDPAGLCAYGATEGTASPFLHRRLAYAALVASGELVCPSAVGEVVSAIEPWLQRPGKDGRSLIECLRIVREGLTELICHGAGLRRMGCVLDWLTGTRSSLDKQVGCAREWFCPYLLRLSDLATTRFWRRADGYNAGELRLVMESASQIAFEATPVIWEFPVIDMAHQLWLGNAGVKWGYCRTLCGLMGWTRISGGNRGKVFEEMICEMIAILWGVPYGAVQVGASMEAVASMSHVQSSYANCSGRSGGVAAMLTCAMLGDCDVSVGRRVQHSLECAIRGRGRISEWTAQTSELFDVASG